MKQINTTDFLAFTKTLAGQEVQTRAGRSKFMVQVVGKGLVFTPLSTLKPRNHVQSYVERVLKQFNQSQSLTCTDYRTMTANSTYMLTLISLYLDQQVQPAQTAV